MQYFWLEESFCDSGVSSAALVLSPRLSSTPGLAEGIVAAQTLDDEVCRTGPPKVFAARWRLMRRVLRGPKA
eukprot:2059282-Pyramimonas_sp.AAC.1